MPKTTVVAHDAGGAEILSSYVKHQRLDCLFVLDGPARKVFERKLGHIETTDLQTAIAASELVLCGTSWQSDMEADAFRLARAAGKSSIAFLDHWVNYRERFTRNGVTCFPDEVWVGDATAYKLAQEKLPEVALRQIDNPYFADIRQSVLDEQRSSGSAPGHLAILYVCEPVREHALLRYGNERHWGYTEEEALRYFLSHVDVLGKTVDRILVRPHPSEAPDKYNAIRDEFNLPISFSDGRQLTTEVAASDCVVGCNSMAMVIGLIAGKRVISCIPPGGNPCALPQPEIEHLQRLLQPD